MPQETYQETALSNARMCFQETAISTGGCVFRRQLSQTREFFSGDSAFKREKFFQETETSPARTFL